MDVLIVDDDLCFAEMIKNDVLTFFQVCMMIFQ